MKNSDFPVLVIIAMLVTGLAIPLDAFADVVSPKAQKRLGIVEDNVTCKANLFKLIKKSTGATTCVKPETAKKLVTKGWAKAVDPGKIDQFVQTVKNRSPIGTATIEAIVKQTVTPGIAKTNPAVSSYHVIFEVCAQDRAIRLPEVIISSDSETRYVKLAEKIPADTCQINAGQVKAASKDTIQAKLVNKGGVTAKLIELENRVKDLTEKLNAEKSLMSTRLNQGVSPNDFKPEEGRLAKIAESRNELNQAKQELNRYLFAHNIIPKIKLKDLEPEKSIAGTPITGIVVNKLSATPQIVQEGGFDVVFEICTADQIVRIPSVAVSSDKETKTVRLADKLSPNSCQLSGVKILATSADDIQVVEGATISKSSTATNLEQKIVDLTKQLQTQKQALKDLTHKNPRPADFNEQALELTSKIIDIRGDITKTKAKVYNLLKSVFE